MCTWLSFSKTKSKSQRRVLYEEKRGDDDKH